MKLQLGLIAMLATLYGCTTTPIDSAQTTRPPADQLLKPELVAKRASESVTQVPVLFIRDAGFYGGGCLHEIYINDEPVVKLGASQSIQLYLPVGRTRFRNEIGGIVCPIFSTAAETDLKENDFLTMRTGTNEGRPFIRLERK